jgi:hypothetical protein
VLAENRVVGDVAPLTVGQLGRYGGAFVAEVESFEQAGGSDVAGIERRLDPVNPPACSSIRRCAADSG